jgi:tetratricopeptide (TPR) repeat protein
MACGTADDPTDGWSVARLEEPDFYARLGLPASATIEQIIDACLTLPSTDEVLADPEQFLWIGVAYHTLTKPTSRAQYDARANPRVSALLATAATAMDANDLSAARHAYEMALLESPDMYRVRDLLGLCCIRDGDFASAAEQYDQLFRDAPDCGEISANANAGEAYGMMMRFADAELAFRNAMRLADPRDAPDYARRLMRIWAIFGNPGIAERFARAELATAPKGSRAAADYMAGMVEVAALAGDTYRMVTLLAEVKAGAVTESERSLAAWTLAEVANLLITRRVLDSAEQIALVAMQLRPLDPDFEAQVQVIRLLRASDTEALAHVLDTHSAFEQRGLMHWIRPFIEQWL